MQEDQRDHPRKRDVIPSPIRGDEFFAIGANCSHYGGPLVEGLMVEDTVRLRQVEDGSRRDRLSPRRAISWI